MATRRSEHNNEFALYRQVRPNPVAAPIAMVLEDSAKSYLDEYGRTVTPPPRYDYLTPVSAGDRGETITTLTSSAEVVGGSTYTHELKVSDRTMGPVEFKVTITGTGAQSLSWLVNGRASGDSGTGSAYQPGEYYFERQGTSEEFRHNPNRDGQTAFPFTPNGEPTFPYVAYPERDTRTHSGLPLFYSASGETFESANHPMDFQNEVIPFHGSGTHGDSATRSSLWYGHRLHQKIRMRWGSTAAVRAVTHRIDSWSYAPTPWNGANDSGPTVVGRFLARYVKPGYFNEAFVYDIDNPGSPITLPGFAQLPGVSNYSQYNLSRSTLSQFLGPFAVTCTAATPMVVTLAAHGMATGAAVRLGGSVPSGGPPWAANTNYYVIVRSANTFELTTSAALATAPGAVGLGATSTGSSVTISKATVVTLSPPSSKYVAILFRNTTTDLAIALAVKFAEPTPPDGSFQQPVLGGPDWVSIGNFWDAAHATGAITEPYAIHLDTNSKAQARRHGWIGGVEYCCVGLTSHVIAAVLALRADGDLDLPPDPNLPPAVTDGTVFPTPHRASAHAHEWAIYSQVRPDPAQGPTSMTLDADSAGKFTISESGATIVPPPVITFLPAEANTATPHAAGNNADAWPAGTSKVISTVVGDYTNRVAVGNRVMAPIYWETSVAGGPSLSWLSPGLETGTGSGLQLNEAALERVGAADAFFHNPTLMGAGQPVETFQGSVFDANHRMRLYAGAPLFYRAEGDTIEAACIPQEFNGYGDGVYGTDAGQRSQDHGTQPVGAPQFTKNALWYGHRFYQRTKLNWRGSPVVHRIEQWGYAPTAWRSDGDSDPLAYWRTANVSVVYDTFDEAFLIDLERGTAAAIEVDGFAPPTSGTDWSKAWTFARNHTEAPSAVHTYGQAYSQHLAVLLKSSSTGMCIALAAKVQDTDSDLDTFSSLRIGLPNNLQIVHTLTAGRSVPPKLDEASSVFLAAQSKSDAERPAGWVASMFYLVVGREADVLAALDELHLSGDMDLVNDQPPPQQVTAGTTMVLAESAITALCNTALSHIGETAQVTSIDPPDGSTQAALCARFYPLARDMLLEMRPWSFTLRRAVLTPITSPEAGTWRYAYLLPADMLTAVSVLPADAIDDYSQSSQTSQFISGTAPFLSPNAPKNYAIERDSLGRRVLYSNTPDAILRYTARTTDASLFSSLFTIALSWKLASMLAGPIIKGDAGAAEAKRCLQMMSAHLGSADSVDANQRQIEPQHIPPWIGGR